MSWPHCGTIDCRPRPVKQRHASPWRTPARAIQRESGMKKAAPKSGFFDTLEAISSKQPKQRPKQRERRRKQQRRRLPQQRKRLQQQRKRLQKRLRKRQQQLALPSCRKQPGPWQRSGKPAGATFSCLCPQKGCQKSGGLGTVFKARDPYKGHKGRGCIATGVAPHSATDYTTHRAIPYRPKVVHGIPSLERCK